MACTLFCFRHKVNRCQKSKTLLILVKAGHFKARNLLIFLILQLTCWHFDSTLTGLLMEVLYGTRSISLQQLFLAYKSTKCTFWHNRYFHLRHRVEPILKQVTNCSFWSKLDFLSPKSALFFSFYSSHADIWIQLWSEGIRQYSEALGL